MALLTMSDLDLKGKRLLIRQDLNVPVKDGKVTNDKRIRASLPTLRAAMDAGAKTLVMSHLGRPTEGQYDEQFSMAPVARRLSELLDRPVKLAVDFLSGVDLAEGELALAENVRFLPGEKADDEALGRRMAALCDIYIMDAFGTAHRAQASTHAVAKFAPVACAGPLLIKELDALDRVLKDPARPLVAIVGGSKVSSKLDLLDNLSQKVDTLIVGGGIANNFLAAAGNTIGKSLYEPDLVEDAKKLMDKAKASGGGIPIPTDVVVATELSAEAQPVIKPVSQVTDQDMILDIGPQTAKHYAELVQGAGTVVWNGPVGVFEYQQFAGGTTVLAHAIAGSQAFSIAGGGETITAVERLGLADKISYISTGGGAFLQFLEGRELPAVAILEERASEKSTAS